jgi:hypothetical protein
MERVSFPLASHVSPLTDSAGWIEVYAASSICTQLGNMGLEYGKDFEFHGLVFKTDGVKNMQYSFQNPSDAMLVKIKGIAVTPPSN